MSDNQDPQFDPAAQGGTGSQPTPPPGSGFPPPPPPPMGYDPYYGQQQGQQGYAQPMPPQPYYPPQAQQPYSPQVPMGYDPYAPAGAAPVPAPYYGQPSPQYQGQQQQGGYMPPPPPMGYDPYSQQPGGFQPQPPAGYQPPPTGYQPPPPPVEDETPANFRLGEKLPAVLKVQVPPHELNFDEQYFLHMLAGSISLTRDEKKKIVESIPKLKQSQVDELIRIFEEEREKFAQLSKKHVDQLEKLAQKHFEEWMDLEGEFAQQSKAAEDAAKAEQIRKQLGL